MIVPVDEKICRRQRLSISSHGRNRTGLFARLISQKRARWARGVLVTARKLKIWRRRKLTAAQKFSCWSSVVYWYFPVKNLIYMLSPLLYALLAVPVFLRTWPELPAFWLPMFILQGLGLRLNSKNAISTKWSGIYETSVMPQSLQRDFGVLSHL